MQNKVVKCKTKFIVNATRKMIIKQIFKKASQYSITLIFTGENIMKYGLSSVTIVLGKKLF